jgi:proline iminopeptidase
MQAGAPLTGAAQVADLEAVRAKLGLDRAYFVGDSYGGALVMAYGAAHPEHVAKMVLSDSAPPSLKDFVHLLPQTFPDYEEKGDAEEKALAQDPAAAAQASLRNHFRMIFYSMEKRDEYMAHMGDLGFEPAVADAISKSGADYDLNPEIVKFHFPTLVITGRYDMNVAPIVAWKLAHEIPGAQMVFFEKSGHLPAYEEPEKYLRVLNDFFGAN